MHLQHLNLVNFRNYPRLELDLQACIHIFQGENAQGKTNLLEAIYCLAAMKSPLAASDRQLIAWQAEDEVLPYTSISGRFIRAQEEHTLDITIMEMPPNGIVHPRATARKQARYDGQPARILDCIGKFNAILFLPDDVGLVSGAPGSRRRYIDASLCQQDPDYCRLLTRYLKALEQRNALLRQVRERQASPLDLSYWDEQLAGLGGGILAKRISFIQALSHYLDSLFRDLTDNLEALRLVYVSPAEPAVVEAEQNARAPSQGVNEHSYADVLRMLLEQRRREEIARAMTVTGPHRDDLRFLINGYDAAEYGSRGQQRTIALALKLAEALLMRARMRESPVLLLDDIFSELDQRRSRLLLTLLECTDQVLITTTDLSVCDPLLVRKACVWRVANATVNPL